MKAVLIIVASIALFVSAGGQMVDLQPAIAAPDQEYELAGSHAEISGTWHSFPVGLLVRFQDDGRASFGLDSTGEAVGQDADAWFEGNQLHIRFNDYAGESEVCETAVGVYEVHVREGGSISFMPVIEDCEVRLNALNGHPDLRSDLVFHPVE